MNKYTAKNRRKLLTICLAIVLLTSMILIIHFQDLLSADVKLASVSPHQKSGDVPVKGNAESLGNLEVAFDYESGAEMSPGGALKRVLITSDLELANSEFNRGKAYLLGAGVEKSDVEAVKWFRKSAEHGHFVSQFQLGSAYLFGKGVETNSIEAVKWFRNSADQGFGMAQFNLGVAYASGEGVPKDYQAAYGWFLLAKAKGIKPALSRLEALEKILSPAEQQAAAVWARDWLPKHQ